MLKKIMLLLLVSSLVMSCSKKEEKINTIESDSTTNKVMNEVVKTKEVDNENTETTNKYGDIEEFISTELSEENKNKLLEILSQRKLRQIEIKKILTQAVIDGNLEKKLEEVKIMRKTCANRILPYVAEAKKESFLAKCDSGNDILKEKFSK